MTIFHPSKIESLLPDISCLWGLVTALVFISEGLFHHRSPMHHMFRSRRVSRLTRDASIAPSYHKRSPRRAARRPIANSDLESRKSTGQAPNAFGGLS